MRERIARENCSRARLWTAVMLLACAAAGGLHAQPPRPSQHGSVTQQIAQTKRDRRLQPSCRTRPRAVWRPGAMGQSVVSGRGQLHDDRALHSCPRERRGARRQALTRSGLNRTRSGGRSSSARHIPCSIRAIPPIRMRCECRRRPGRAWRWRHSRSTFRWSTAIMQSWCCIGGRSWSRSNSTFRDAGTTGARALSTASPRDRSARARRRNRRGRTNIARLRVRSRGDRCNPEWHVSAWW